ncbi:MAG TPA: hypothetical protein VIK32_03415, partial [Candidatus Limnocylindrales bacterium]
APPASTRRRGHDRAMESGVGGSTLRPAAYPTQGTAGDSVYSLAVLRPGASPRPSTLTGKFV